MKKFLCIIPIAAALCGCVKTPQIPLPEHPRPDFERAEWVNLNGYWDFTFDREAGFDKKILVPFPWGSKLSEVENEGDVAWYSRSIKVPRRWEGKRIFVIVGASDFRTDAWIDGQSLGSHKGGYVPFEFELTPYVKFGQAQTLEFKADDTPSDTHPYGKQGYGDARGIWQTVYLEARGENHIKTIHFTPDTDASSVRVDVSLAEAAAEGSQIRLDFADSAQPVFTASISGSTATFEVPLKDQHLWDLDDPYLYEVKAALISGGRTEDEVSTYFGQRKISVEPLPGREYNYVALNGKPLYLQLCLDQSYTPDGFYTFPSDEFMKNEILISKNLGLNGNRIHIKVEVPRKLYWADKLGLLIMADTPNFWGAPVPEARENWEECLRAQVERDYNHPCIFSWVNFNETWGLFSDGGYTPETQSWVEQMYHLTKSLDPSRLVEDNSACNRDHVVSDINSWHGYHRGYIWDRMISEFDEGTFPGSGLNYVAGRTQGSEPMINSECGNVWGYENSAGDCDFTWDYHIMMDAFRRHPKCAGWLYTEHHDVVNEWNGYVQYDRTPKFDGLADIVPGMSLKDFHSPYYVEADKYLVTRPSAGQTVEVPVYASFMTDRNPGALTLETKLAGWDDLGVRKDCGGPAMDIPFEPYFSAQAGSLSVEIPQYKGLYVLQMVLKNASGEELHHNFTVFKVDEGLCAEGDFAAKATFRPDSFSGAEWSLGAAEVLGGLKQNGFGNGWFEYEIKVPENRDKSKGARILFEASAKEMFGKDVKDGSGIVGDFMLGGGTEDHCKSPNSYAMTDDDLWASEVVVSVNGREVGRQTLNDDPADHRGILSWCSQPDMPRLFEAGSYGELVSIDVPADAIEGDTLKLRIAVPGSVHDGLGGLAIYGKDFGRYPLDPTVLFF